MNLYKKFIIKHSPNANLYGELILENCLHNLDESNDENTLDIIFNDDELTNILYNIIVYGNLKSRTNESLNLHSRIHSLDRYDKHQMAIEVEKYQRIQFYLHNVLLISLFVSLSSLLYYYLV